MVPLTLQRGAVGFAGAWLLVGLHAAAALADPPVRDPNPEVLAQILRGDELFAENRLGKAKQAYETAAELARADGALPVKSLRRLANAYYFEGRFRSAAKVLDELAEEAATFGDLPAQAWALVDAAWLWGKMGSEREVNQRLEKVERLIASPYMPEEVRFRIASTKLNGARV